MVPGESLSLEDVAVVDGCFLDAGNGGGGLTLTVDDLVMGQGAGFFTNTSVITVEGTCSGAGNPQPFCP
jgi:hypothetical protein